MRFHRTHKTQRNFTEIMQNTSLTRSLLAPIIHRGKKILCKVQIYRELFVLHIACVFNTHSVGFRNSLIRRKHLHTYTREFHQTKNFATSKAAHATVLVARDRKTMTFSKMRTAGYSTKLLDWCWSPYFLVSVVGFSGYLQTKIDNNTSTECRASE